MSRSRGLWSEQAQALVEYALVLPILLLFLFGIMEFGVIVFSRNTIDNAAREGARYGMLHPDDAGGIEAAARNLTTGLDGANLQVSSTATANTVRVEVDYSINLLTGLIIDVMGGNPTLELQAVATMQIE